MVAAAEAGAKGIFCEKPLATSVEDADRMVTAQRKRHNTLLSVDHTRHWMPVWHRCHELVTAGEIGDVRTVLVRALRHAINVVPQRHPPARRHHVVRWQ